MSGIGLIILGGVIGAAATGGVQVWIGKKQRLLDRKVAARVILGDLYLTEGLLQGVIEYRQWPLVLDISRPIETWREFRRSFAATVTVVEWIKVDSIFGVLHQISLGATLGEESVEAAMPMVEGLLKRIPEAQEIVRLHAVDSEAELKEIVQAMEARP